MSLRVSPTPRAGGILAQLPDAVSCELLGDKRMGEHGDPFLAARKDRNA
jgi:hypothetical protein